MTLEQMVAQFSLDRVQKSGAKFDKEKLNWFNNHYLRLLSDEKLAQLSGAPAKFVSLFKERANTLIELGAMAKELMTVSEYPATLLVWRKSDAAGAKACLSAARAVVAGLGDMSDSKAIEGAFSGLLAEKGKGDVLWPLRVALSGKEASPGPFDLLAALGQAESLARIDAGLAKL
jgi:glutamyl/glutaminyl-tRNA synthetase